MDMEEVEAVMAEKESPRGVLENPGVGSDSDSTSSSSSICSNSSSAAEKPVSPENSSSNICSNSSSAEENPVSPEKGSNNICSNSSSAEENPVSPEKSSSFSSLDFNGLPWKQIFGNFKKKSPISFSIFPFVASYEISRKNLMKKLSKFYGSEEDDEIPVVKSSWKNFSYSELAIATDNFSQENLLGEGGSAEVYKGTLSDGQIVAVKKFINNEMEEKEERASDLLSELGIISHINHPNAAHLIGYSIDECLILVLQFSPHGSLASLLFGSTERFDWKTRFKVVLGVAEGLKYLHHECPRRIIHRDIKASNILLTEDYEAQISDFGLAKWLPENWKHHVVHPIEGTFGYLAPEYFMHGIVDEKTDVFAYGVLLLEILTGRRAVDSCSRQSLVIWAKPLLESNDVKQLVDPRLEDDYDPTEMKRAMSTASLCISHLASMRPYMIKIVELLTSDEQDTLESQPKSCEGKAVIMDNCDSQAYSRTSYQNDLNRHMQLVME